MKKVFDYVTMLEIKFPSKNLFYLCTHILWIAILVFGYFSPARADRAVAAEDEWSIFKGNVARTGNLDNIPGPATAKVRWSFRDEEYSAAFTSSPAVVNNRVYVGCDNDTVYCFDADSGEALWRFETEYEVFSSPAVVDGKVYVGEGLHYTQDANFYCLDADTGELLWKFPTTSHTESSPAVSDGKVYFGAGEDGVYCLDASSGKKIWQFPGVHVDAAPLVVENSVFFGVGYGQPSIYCLNANSGETCWQTEVNYPAWGSPAHVDGKLYAGIGNGTFVRSADDPVGEIICLNADSGNILWRYSAEDSVNTTIAVADNRAYFGSRDGFLYCLDANLGKLIWKYLVGEPVLSSPSVVGNRVYFGANDGLVYCLETSKGEVVWNFDIGGVVFLMDIEGGVISSPAIYNGKVYVGSSDMTFYCFEEEK